MSILYDCYKSNRERPFIQSGGDTKDLRSHGNPFMYEEGANLSETSNNKRIEINFKTVLLLGLSYFVIEGLWDLQSNGTIRRTFN